MSTTLTKPRFYDAAGRLIEASIELGRGGEGVVYGVQGRPQEAIKLYLKPIDSEKSLKLKSMALLSNPKLCKIAAWPIAPLYEQPHGRINGLLMPKVELSGFKEIHMLYGTASRKQTFPQADWHYIVRAARNLASAVNQIHEAGIIIGDINEKNVLIATQDIRPMFLDCDSFQIQGPSQTFHCEVGVPHYTPPELQGKSFRSITRTKQHDAFGLAILLFRLLFLARHPFAGRYTGPGEQPLIEKAIENSWFCYGRKASAYQMAPPPGTLTLDSLPPKVSDLFERAFSPDAIHLQNRPSAMEWVKALEYLEDNLKLCSRNQAHKYYSGAAFCPWCRLESSGVVLFLYTATVQTPSGQTIDIHVVWQRISAIPSLGPAPIIDIPSSQYLSPSPLSEHTINTIRADKRRSLVFTIIILIIGSFFVYSLTSVGQWFWGLVVGWIVWAINNGVQKAQADYGEEFSARKQALKVANERFQYSKDRWEKEAGDKQFLEKMKTLSQCYLELKDLDQACAKDKRQLANDGHKNQLQKFLERHYIRHANLSGIGAGLKATLGSYGYETAADLMTFRIGLVPGFGEKRVSMLIAWRRSVEAQFTYNPNQGIDPRDLQTLNNKYAQKRSTLTQSLLRGEQELQTIKQGILTKRATWRAQLEDLARDVAQKQADLRVF